MSEVGLGCVTGSRARCGNDECQEVLLFQHPDSTMVCQECGASCDLTGAVVEYETLALRIVQLARQIGDDLLNDQAERGWVVDKMNTVQEPNSTHIVVVYLLRRLVANMRWLT